MSQRVIYKSPVPNNPVSRGIGPIHLSPRSKPKQPNRYRQQDSSLTPPKNNYLTEAITSNQNVLKGLQQHPLEFSSNRKHKSKQIQPNPPLNPLASFMGPSVYTRHLGNPVFQNCKISNENQNVQASSTNFSNKIQVLEIQKLRNYYQNQIRSLRDGHILLQQDFNQKYRDIEKQKNCWRQNYMKLKQEFHQYKKGIQQKQKPKHQSKQTIQQYGFTLNRYNNNKPNILPINQNLINLQQEIQNVNKSLKVAQNQIYGLNKLKAELNYEIGKLTEDNKKAVSKITELECQIEKLNKNNYELSQKIIRLEQLNIGKSLDFKPEPLSASMDIKILGRGQALPFNKQIDIQDRGSQRSHSSSTTRSRSSSSSLSSSLSSSSKNKSSSRHHRSHSNNGHTSSSHHRSHPNGAAPELMHMHINFDFNKQMDKMKYACRKLQKTVVNQNQQIMMDGLKRLNTKYAHYDEQQNIPKIYDQYQYYSKANFSNESKIVGQSNLYSFSQPYQSSINQSTKATYDLRPIKNW